MNCYDVFLLSGEARMQVQVCAAEAQQTMNLCYGSHALDPCFKKRGALGGGESVDLGRGMRLEFELTPAASR